ncbi:MAG TPA: hypothetical protein VFN72_12485 [Solirubrobacterales bacterium]|nr:hypothetical protein [Solirubrobacterales bacterium]
MSRPLLSVLLPLQDERETALASFQAWSDQSADRSAYEIIVLAPGQDPEMEDEVRPLLRDEDSWIARPGRDEYELFDIGADAAQGEYLFLTEAHCVPDRDCIAVMLAELERTGADGVRGESVPDVRGPLGRLELEMFDEAQKQEEDPEHWRKVLIHSLALRRAIFLEAGGTPSRYGDFCTWVLAISLHRSGMRMAYSPKPRVSHTYDGDLEHVAPFIRSFRRGEVLYRTERPPQEQNGYLEWVPEWERRLEFTRSGGWRALRAGMTLRHRGALAGLHRHLGAALLGPRAAMAESRLRAAAAARRTRGGSDPEVMRAPFREFWSETSRLGVLEGLLETNPAPPPAESNPALTESWAGRALGLHDVERLDGEAFRWTAPLALLHVSVPGPGRRRARLELLPFQRPHNVQANPRVAVDERRVPIHVSGDAIEFDIDPGEHWIAIAARALRPRRFGVEDPRALGLPLRSLEFVAPGSQNGR